MVFFPVLSLTKFQISFLWNISISSSASFSISLLQWLTFFLCPSMREVLPLVPSCYFKTAFSVELLCWILLQWLKWGSSVLISAVAVNWAYGENALWILQSLLPWHRKHKLVSHSYFLFLFQRDKQWCILWWFVWQDLEFSTCSIKECHLMEARRTAFSTAAPALLNIIPLRG